MQQLLARCAGEVAAAGVAVANAGRAADRQGLAGAESRSPRPRWWPARPPGPAPTSSTRSMPPSASPTTTRCTSSPDACGTGATAAARNGSGRRASAAPRWRAAATKLWADLTAR
ncbi:hypothetical protein [Dankookia sp. P2]|uniref:hypothetical protein n=1 Tax=Dankookia sp. P2 TaxID=3423955 RepID=UPI003D67E594